MKLVCRLWPAGAASGPSRQGQSPSEHPAVVYFLAGGGVAFLASDTKQAAQGTTEGRQIRDSVLRALHAACARTASAPGHSPQPHSPFAVEAAVALAVDAAGACSSSGARHQRWVIATTVRTACARRLPTRCCAWPSPASLACAPHAPPPIVAAAQAILHVRQPGHAAARRPRKAVAHAADALRQQQVALHGLGRRGAAAGTAALLEAAPALRWQARAGSIPTVAASLGP